MKMKYKFGLLGAAALIAGLSSCANHDLIPDIAQVGQAVPTVYWEVGSTVCKAGEAFTFQGKYNSVPGRIPVKSEVWYLIVRDDVATVTTKLGGTSLNYSQTVSLNDTMRTYQSQAVFPHNEEYWNGHEYIVNGEVPVSRTLTPVSWVDAKEWDWERFNTYYPEGFIREYLDKIYDYLTGESANSYYSALRTVYLNYDFTNDQFKAVGLPELDLSGDDGGTSVKSDAWYSTTEASDDKIVGYYYITIDEAGKTVYNEVPVDYQAPEGIQIYPVYDSSEWVFCRYDDNSGAIVSTVRPEWLPKFRELLENIPFQAWIYDSSNAVYKVDFARNYSLRAQFRAYDKDASEINNPDAFLYEGIVSDTEVKEISIN